MAALGAAAGQVDRGAGVYLPETLRGLGDPLGSQKQGPVGPAGFAPPQALKQVMSPTLEGAPGAEAPDGSGNRKEAKVPVGLPPAQEFPSPKTPTKPKPKQGAGGGGKCKVFG